MHAQKHHTWLRMFRHEHTCETDNVVFLPHCSTAATMKIASFNIQKFGKNKVSDPDVLNILVKVTHTSAHLHPQKGLGSCTDSSPQLAGKASSNAILGVVHLFILAGSWKKKLVIIL